MTLGFVLLCSTDELSGQLDDPITGSITGSPKPLLGIFKNRNKTMLILGTEAMIQVHRYYPSVCDYCY